MLTVCAMCWVPVAHVADFRFSLRGTNAPREGVVLEAREICPMGGFRSAGFCVWCPRDLPNELVFICSRICGDPAGDLPNELSFYLFDDLRGLRGRFAK